MTPVESWLLILAIFAVLAAWALLVHAIISWAASL